MLTLQQSLKLTTRPLLFLCFLCTLMMSCGKDDALEAENPDPVQEENSQDNDTPDPGQDTDSGSGDEDPNAISSNLIFNTSTEVQGNIPDASHTIELKTDKDTIFLTKGIKNRIRIFHPPSFQPTRTFISVNGSDRYFDVPLDEESRDTVAVLYLEFDPDDWELPILFDIKIAPDDGSGTPEGDITIPVEVEEKGNLTINPWDGKEWDWIYTIINGEIERAPGLEDKTETQVVGCCLDGESVDCITNYISEDEWIEVKGTSIYGILFESLSFTPDGYISGGLREYIRNLDPKPEKTDFCTGAISYIIHTKDHLFWGDYTFDPSNGRIQLSNLESHSHEVDLGVLGTYIEYDKMFINSNYLYEIVSDHFLMETGSVEGTSTIRLFERRGNPSDTND